MTQQDNTKNKSKAQKRKLRELTREEMDAVTGGPGGGNKGHGIP